MKKKNKLDDHQLGDGSYWRPTHQDDPDEVEKRMEKMINHHLCYPVVKGWQCGGPGKCKCGCHVRPPLGFIALITINGKEEKFREVYQ